MTKNNLFHKTVFTIFCIFGLMAFVSPAEADNPQPPAQRYQNVTLIPETQGNDFGTITTQTAKNGTTVVYSEPDGNPNHIPGRKTVQVPYGGSITVTIKGAVNPKTGDIFRISSISGPEGININPYGTTSNPSNSCHVTGMCDNDCRPGSLSCTCTLNNVACDTSLTAAFTPAVKTVILIPSGHGSIKAVETDGTTVIAYGAPDGNPNHLPGIQTVRLPYNSSITVTVNADIAENDPALTTFTNHAETNYQISGLKVADGMAPGQIDPSDNKVAPFIPKDFISQSRSYTYTFKNVIWDSWIEANFVAAPGQSGIENNDWRFDPYPLGPAFSANCQGNAFGNVVYDPDAPSNPWRFFYSCNPDTDQLSIWNSRGPSPRAFSNPVQLMGPNGIPFSGTPGSWDQDSVGVPYVWYEPNQLRPWRMLYRGCRLNDTCMIGLATAEKEQPDGTIIWEKKDPNGNPFPVLNIGSIQPSTDGTGNVQITATSFSPFSLYQKDVSIGGVQIMNLGSPAPLSEDHINNNISTKNGHIETPAFWTIEDTPIYTQVLNKDGSTTYSVTFTINQPYTALTITGYTYSGGVVSQALIQPSMTKGALDSPTIDFGSVIKVPSAVSISTSLGSADFPPNTYYVYYSVIGGGTQYLRREFLATSTDLVHWFKYPNTPIESANAAVPKPLFSGVSDHADKSNPGTVDLSAGFFCPDVVNWPDSSNTPRYVFITPHYVDGGTTPSYDVYTSPYPVFEVSHRTYIGKLLRTDLGHSPKLNGYILGSSGLDTPRIITDDITRNVAASTRTGNDVLLVASVYTGGLFSWNHVMLVYNKAFHGSILDNVSGDFPVSANPSFSLAPAGTDPSTAALWLPGKTGSLRELSGTNMHLSGNYTAIDSKGVEFNAQDQQYLQFAKGADYATESLTPNINGISLDSVRNDFTLEATVIPQTIEKLTSGHRSIFYYGLPLQAQVHFSWFIEPGGRGLYQMVLSMTSNGSNIHYTSAAFSLLDGKATSLAIERFGDKVYAFKDGKPLDSGQTFPYIIDPMIAPENKPFNPYIVVGNDLGYSWDGWIDELRISNKVKYSYKGLGIQSPEFTSEHPMNYVVAPQGHIFGPVYDLTTNDQNADNWVKFGISSSSPQNNSLMNIYTRFADNDEDQSSDIDDFYPYTQTSLGGGKQQWAVSMISSGDANSPALDTVESPTRPQSILEEN